MKGNTIIHCFVLIQILFVINCSASFKSHYGKEFILGMIPNFGEADIKIDIASEFKGFVQLYVPYLNMNRTETLRVGHTTLTIDKHLVKQGNFSEKRAFQITTNVPVAVFISSYDSVTPETYLGLPITFVGKLYVLSSYTPSSYYSEVAIVSAYQNTTVNFNKGHVVTIDKLYMSQTVSNLDLTGTIVSATNPVSVISGSQCAIIPLSGSNCDIIVEQMIPVSMWTNIYIIPPLPPESRYFARVQTLNSNYICAKNNTQKTCKQIKQDSYIELQFDTEPTVVYSNDSTTFSVTQYGISDGEGEGTRSGPFMTVIPGLNNFLTKYSFVVPPVYSSLHNYVTVIIKRADVIGLRLDGKVFQAVYNYSVSRPLDHYVVLVTSISTGYHILNSTDPSAEFGAFMYGLKSSAGYGTPLGYKFKDESSISQSTNLRCYHCDEMSSLEVCDAVKPCTDAQICFAERYITRAGYFYRSGCIPAQQCQNTRSSSGVCLECCQGNYCNNKGCGDDRFPDRKIRGPMCYDCQHILNDTDLCMKVTMCGPDEVCSIEKYRWGNDFHYKMGCTHKLCTPMRRSSVPRRLRRSTPVCSACCADDFCNANCTQTTNNPTGEIIVG